jgi:CHAT domain-containing protein
MRPGGPPAEEALADDLAALRAVTFEREQALAAGRGTPALARRQAVLERSIRDRWRRAAGGGAAAARMVRPGALAQRLDGRILVEFVAVDGRLQAIVVSARRTTMHGLGTVDAVAAELRSLRFALRRIAAGRAPDGSSAGTALAHSAGALGDMLLEPLRREIKDSPLVIVPTGVLHGVPWSLLPGCAQRPVSVAPSAQMWLRAAAAPPLSMERTVLIAGPGLPGADSEVTSLAAAYPDARCLVGLQAGVAEALAALDGADCVHLAAHGHFRDDNPQFSALTLADGPLTVFDLERLRRPPRLVVLSACDSGVSAVHAGDEMMGFAAALLALGSTALIATVVPVLDTSAAPLMVALHAGLRAGKGPAAALAAAQSAAASTVEAAAFVCYGAG